ncbi:MAG: shikimate kinase [Candidatus Melainabacteria bacterium]|nr:shikimate kinase [Candidatus Melainabacteria bacterium]
MSKKQDVAVPIDFSVVLTGYMGAGKTTLARRLSECLECPFVDTDLWIESEKGLSVSEIFTQFGESAFRDFEKEALIKLLSQKPQIIATGGGLLAQTETLQYALGHALVVYLKASPEVLWQRVASAQHNRPLLSVERPYEQFVERYHQRQPYYEQAPIIVCTDALPEAKTLEALLDAIITYRQTRSVAALPLSQLVLPPTDF